MLAIKPQERYRFKNFIKTKRVQYTAIWKKSIKIVKESKLSISYHVSLLNLFIPSTTILIFYYFPPPPPPHFYCFPSRTSSFWLFSLFLLILIVLIGSMWGPCRVDMGSMWGRCRFDVGSLLFSLLLLLLISIVFPSPPPHFYCFPSKRPKRPKSGL